jgi:hypothetical protein
MTAVHSNAVPPYPAAAVKDGNTSTPNKHKHEICRLSRMTPGHVWGLGILSCGQKSNRKPFSRQIALSAKHTGERHVHGNTTVSWKHNAGGERDSTRTASLNKDENV